MRILTNLFPDAKKTALTMSYDDGCDFDKRLVEIFNKNGIKGTFHLNSVHMSKPGNGRVQLDEVKELYKGHEVSCHTFTHPHPTCVPDTMLVNEILEDRRALEKACGYTVRGMSYPYGDYNDHTIGIFRSCGMLYSRTTVATGNFNLPEDFMKWHPTCHHRPEMEKLFDTMRAQSNRWTRHSVMYVWGHSYEFDVDDNWEYMESILKKLAFHDDIFYGTNSQILLQSR